MTALRVVLAVLGAALLAGGLALGIPGVYRVSALAGLALFVVGAGALAADAIPWRGLRAACSLATMAVGALALVRLAPAAAAGALALALQLVPRLARR